MPRRKRGRDKPRGKRRNRSKDLPRLNIRAALRRDEPRSNIRHDPLTEEADRWKRRNRPASEGRTIEDILGLNVMEGKPPFREKRELKGAEEKDVAA